MPKADDPYYNRKQVPDTLIEGTGVPGLSVEEAYENRQHKLSTVGPGGTDVRKFSNLLQPKGDPFYHRKPVPDAAIQGTGVPGLTEDQAYISRERKLSTAGPNGTDVRKFSIRWEPKNDPYYNRKPIPDQVLKNDGVEAPPALDAYEGHERKVSMFQLGSDPFDQITGRRSSTVPDSALGVGRRRSSAVAPDIAHDAAKGHHSYADGARLEPIESRTDGPAATTTTTTTTTTHSNGAVAHGTDDIGPHDIGPGPLDRV